MTKKKGYYAVSGPLFKGIVRSQKEYNDKVIGQKNTFGKRFSSQEEAQQWIEQFPGKPQKVKKAREYYAIHTPDFKGIVSTLAEYNRSITGKPHACGKKFSTQKAAQQWLENFEPPSSKLAATTVHTTLIANVPVSPAQEVIIYIDGGFKDGIGKYGLVAYSPKKTERVYQNFGHVYDQNFNDLTNAGAELMACLRALEWAFSNGMKSVHIIYDFEGIQDHLVKAPVHAATRIYQQMLAKFNQHMRIHFLHIRHGNKELHKEAHNLTQLAL